MIAEIVNIDAEPPPGDFYVAVRDAGRTGLLLGPFDDLRVALVNVERGRDLACDRDSRAWFYSYGTARLPIGTAVKTVFGR